MITQRNWLRESSYLLEMKSSNMSALLVAAWCSSGMARAQLELVTNVEPPCVFFGEAKNISATFHNPGAQEFKGGIRTRIFQASSATAVLLGERPWKILRVLPRQTVFESAPLDFPPVKARTKFIVQWLENANRVMGQKEVMVYPTNLLDGLKLLVEESRKNLGVLDPKNQLKPALKRAAIPFADLAETELDAFAGKLALVASSGSDDPDWRGLMDRIGKLAQKGTPVVWIQAPPQKRDKLWPSFYAVPQNRAAVVVVQPGLVADLPDNPPSQLALIYFCRLALSPQPLTLPDLSAQP
jgi:hypothetical protein